MNTFLGRILSFVLLLAFAPCFALTASASSAIAQVGQAVTFSVTADGTAPFNYQWRKNSVDIPSATGASYTINSVVTGDAATYTARVSNAAGWVYSDNATLTVTAVPAPAITSSLNASASVGSAFSYQISASGSPTSYNAASLPTGLSVNTSTGVISGTPTAADFFSMTLSASNQTGPGIATLALTIAKGSATVTLGSLSQTYNGSPKSATATTSPADLAVIFTYNGSTFAPTGVGNYTVVGTVNDANYSGSASGTLVIAKGTATVTLGSLSQTYNGSAKAATATTSPADLAVIFTYNGSTTAPTATGSYPVVGTVNDSNYSGSAIGTLVIAKGTAIVTLGNLSQTYDGLPKSATATTLPASLAVIFTYNGSATAPTAIGSYAVVGTVNSANYVGSANGTLAIAAANPNTPVINSSLSSSATVGNAFNYQITATNTPTSFGAFGLPTGLNINTSTGLISGTPVNAGSATIALSATNASGIGTATLSLTTAKGRATVTLGNLTPTYDGTAKAATATTLPAGLTVDFTYDGSTVTPINPGSYAVVGTVNNENFTGNASGTLVIASSTTAALIPDGFAASVTGGGNLTAVTVTTPTAFKAQVETASAAVITVAGNLDLRSLGSAGKISVKSNKTIQGLDANAGIIGTLELATGVTNVAIRGLNITNPAGDGIALAGASNAFITHCTFVDCSGSLIAITHGASNVTASWNEFFYTTAQTANRYAIQIDGTGGSATTPSRVSLHHNWWSTRCDQRMPDAKSSNVHLYNNYYDLTGNTSGVTAQANAQLLVERNQFSNLANPLSKSSGGLIRSLGNAFTGTTGAYDSGADPVFTPSYSYEILPVTHVAATLIAATSGAGNTAGAASISPVSATAIITGPVDAVPSGSSFTLTALANGFSGNSYQWRLNNVDIVGANAVTYSVSSIQSSHAGDYAVVIGLASGSHVVSSSLKVSLASSSSSSSSSSGSSSSSSGASLSPSAGSSGGGGAPSHWFFAALMGLAALRRALQRMVR